MLGSRHLVLQVPKEGRMEKCCTWFQPLRGALTGLSMQTGRETGTPSIVAIRPCNIVHWAWLTRACYPIHSVIVQHVPEACSVICRQCTIRMQRILC